MKAVYTLPELKNLAQDPAFTEKPARLAVIGKPIHHSASPQMHQAALDEAGIPATYIRLEVAPGEVKKAFLTMRDLGFIGANVTVPHKKEAMDACDWISDDAQILGAVNTIKFGEKLEAWNSDGPGFLEAINVSFGKKLSSLSVLVLGAGGGAGTAISTQCALIGVKKLILANRTASTAHTLAERLRLLAPDSEITSTSLKEEDISTHVKGIDLIINTTSLGLKESDPLPISPRLLESSQLFYDTIYKPAKTPLYLAAETLGLTCDNGLSLLLHQGAISFGKWFGNAPNIQVMQKGLGL